jgi:hypothetical protein
MAINPDGSQQEPLFPTSNEERILLQESLLDLLAREAELREKLKVDTAAGRGEIAKLQRRIWKLEELLRQSRPRRA